MILAIYCAGGLGREILDFVRSMNENQWEKIIFVDDVTEEKNVNGAVVFRFAEVEQFRGNIEFVIANGEPANRQLLYDKIKGAGFPMGTVISPKATIWTGAEIGEGCIIGEAIISVDVKLGNNVFIQHKCILGHDVKIGDHSLVSNLCFVGGYTQIGNRVYMAPGSMAKDRLKVDDDSIIGLGAILTRNVKEKSIMVGNPAKKIGENTEGTVFNVFPKHQE